MFKVPEYYKIAVVYTLILFLDRIDITIINVAIVTISKHFDIPINLSDWISTSFLIGLSISMGVSSCLCNRFGYKATFLWAVTGFALFAIFLGFCNSFSEFVVCRFLQGIFGGIIIPTGAALLYMSCDKADFAKASNFVFLPTLIAPALGPFLGGMLLKYFSYRSIFFVNVPICLAVIILGALILRNNHSKTSHQFDYIGFVLSSSICVLFFVSISDLSCKHIETAILLMLVIAVLTLIFIKIELISKYPILQLRFLKGEFFSRAVLIQLFFQMSHFGSFFIIGLYLQSSLGFYPSSIGIIIAMQALGAMCVTVYSKTLFYKYGAVLPLATGLIGVAVVTPLILIANSNHNLIYVAAIMLLRGLFSGLVGTPLHTISMYDKQANSADLIKLSSMFGIARQVSISCGVCISALLVNVANSMYHFNYISYINSTYISYKIFLLPIVAISIFCAIGACIAFTINNLEVIKITGGNS